MLTTIFMLSAMVVISLIAIDMITSGIVRRRAEGASSKAYYAAEAGSEMAMLLLKKGIYSTADNKMYDNCAKTDPGAYVDFNAATPTCTDARTWKNIEDNTGLASYSVKITKANDDPTNRELILNSRGSFGGTNREVQINFCIPSCLGYSTGSNLPDGCGGICQ